MNEKQIDEIIACLPRGRTLFPYFRDRYAALLLSWFCNESVSIAAIKRSRYASLLNNPSIKQLLAQLGDGRASAEVFSLAAGQQHDQFLLTLGKWGGDSVRWQQTSRHGHNLVLQVNLNEGHRRLFDKAVPRSERWIFDNDSHPVLQPGEEFYRTTLGWIRLDIDIDAGEVLIEEIQTDWLRDVRRLEQRHTPAANKTSERVCRYCETTVQRFGKIWAEALLSAALWFVREELGMTRVWYHTFDFGCQLKRIRYFQPPRSVYTQLPRRFCFEQVSEAPGFLQRDKGYRRLVKHLPAFRGVKPAPQWFHLQL